MLLLQAARLSTIAMASSSAESFFIAILHPFFHLFRAAAPPELHIRGTAALKLNAPSHGRAHYIASNGKIQGLFAMYTDFSQIPIKRGGQYP